MAKTPRTSKSAADKLAALDATARKALKLDVPAAPVPAPQPVGVLTLAQWRENPGYQARLRLLLDDPIFQHAHATLMAIAFPCVEPSSKADVGIGAEAADQALSRKFIHRSGFGYFPRMLRVLTVPQATGAAQNGYELQLEPEDE